MGSKNETIYKLYQKFISNGFSNIEGNDTPDEGPKINEDDLKKEKKDLKDLNERLSKYIEKVRSLEQGNLTLENELQQLKRSCAQVEQICEEEKSRLNNECEDENNKYKQQQQKEEELKAKYNKEKEDLQLAEKTMNEKLDTLSKETNEYAEMETKIVCLVGELKFCDKIICEMKKKKQQKELYEEQVEDYKKQTTEYKIKKETLQSEIRLLKVTKTEEEKSQTEEQYEKEKELLVNQKTEKEDAIKTITEQISNYRRLQEKKDELDGEIKEYSTLLGEGERRIHS